MRFEQYIKDDFGAVHEPDGRDWDQWVSASRTRNWCKRNPLQDWLVRRGAMVGAWWCYREAGAVGVGVSEVGLMQDIARYNEVDCKVMAETIAYLRARHLPA